MMPGGDDEGPGASRKRRGSGREGHDDNTKMRRVESEGETIF